MYLYGASGHAKVIIDILHAINEPIEALFDDNETINNLFDYPVLHTSEIKGPLLISIGNNNIRKKIAESVSVTIGQAFHPSAIISAKTNIDKGTVVMQGAIIQSDVNIGKHCIINTGASIDHESLIGDYVHISPHCTLCGNVEIGEGVLIGAGTTIIPGVKIGCWSVIGAGSVVAKDIPDHVLAVGNRCKVVKNL
ncbi:acetyltransferase [Oscillospiraceae bacterium N12]|jgi:sugar O-acyltransferase (sialic acid O-acetyltransferase NeuD family)|uniref:Acetyltransferase n=1 Tax=Jilunia laotingensis TaxID=2763675 RepID=A0A926F0J9_9BACT|nr:acetyltransferase [Jilunia laotingensis]MBC8591848.1 acetyltransferase [Jilunia laotingensis]